MKEIQQFAPSHMNNAAHFLFVSNMAGRAEKDTTVAEKCATQVTALRAAALSRAGKRGVVLRGEEPRFGSRGFLSPPISPAMAMASTRGFPLKNS